MLAGRAGAPMPSERGDAAVEIRTVLVLCRRRRCLLRLTKRKAGYQEIARHASQSNQLVAQR